MIQVTGRWSAILVNIAISKVRAEKAVSFSLWCVFAVACLTAVVYDCGAHDVNVYLTELLTESLYYSPALTFGQEVGWAHYRSSDLTLLTQNDFIVWTSLGEQIHMSRGVLDTNTSNLWQRQRWSFMTFLYLSVHSFWSLKVRVLTSKCARCDTLEYYTLCMFAGLRSSSWKYADKPSHGSVMMMSMLPIHTGVVSSDRWHAVYLPSASLTDAVSILCATVAVNIQTDCSPT
jgi:hypothetical protein